MHKATRIRLERSVPEALKNDKFTTIREFEKLTKSRLHTLNEFFDMYPDLHIQYLQRKRRNYVMRHEHRLRGVQVRIRAGEGVQEACDNEGMHLQTYRRYERDYKLFVENEQKKKAA